MCYFQGKAVGECCSCCQNCSSYLINYTPTVAYNSYIAAEYDLLWRKERKPYEIA